MFILMCVFWVEKGGKLVVIIMVVIVFVFSVMFWVFILRCLSIVCRFCWVNGVLFNLLLVLFNLMIRL